MHQQQTPLKRRSLMETALLAFVGFLLILFVGYLALANWFQADIAPTVQKATQQFLGIRLDPKRANVSSSQYGGSGYYPALGLKSPARSIDLFLANEKPLNERLVNVLKQKLDADGFFETVHIYSWGQRPPSGSQVADRWGLIDIDPDIELTYETQAHSGNALTQSEVKIGYSTSSAFQWHSGIRSLPEELPLLQESPGMNFLGLTISYPGHHNLEEMLDVIIEKSAGHLSSMLISDAKSRHENFGELPKLSDDFWPDFIAPPTPAFLDTVNAHLLHQQRGLLTPCEAVWICEVRHSELKEFYARAQTELVEDQFQPWKPKQTFDLDQAPFKSPPTVFSFSTKADCNARWSIAQLKDPVFDFPDRDTQNSTPEPTRQRLLIQYLQQIPAYDHRQLVNRFFDDPDVTLELMLMFREILQKEDRASFLKLLERFDAPDNDLLLSFIRLDLKASELSQTDFLTLWKPLFIRTLSTKSVHRYESISSNMLSKRKLKWMDLINSMAEDLRSAGIVELTFDHPHQTTLNLMERQSFFLVDDNGLVHLISVQNIIHPSNSHFQASLEIRSGGSGGSSFTSRSVSMNDLKAENNYGQPNYDIRVLLERPDTTTTTFETKIEVKKNNR